MVRMPEAASISDRLGPIPLTKRTGVSSLSGLEMASAEAWSIIFIIFGFIALAYGLCYKCTPMRSHHPGRRATAVILPLLLLTACGGRSLNKSAAQKLIVNLSGDALSDEDCYIDSVTQTGERNAVVEARLRVAFRFSRTGGKWVIEEVKVGRDRWVSFADFRRALERMKIEETTSLLEKVAAAIGEYRRKNGRLPEFRDFVSLTDALSPDYLTPLVRLDAWKEPVAVVRQGPDTLTLISPGPDGKLHTPDDIELTKTFPKD
jgi:hypothetical protein